ncbi:MAG: MEMO1 family protein [Candidatus Aenigmarchaeota archaeon]|nr:MEMO1 family protein [Candidatus Aenigmarchaeota archaeon]
MSLVFAGISPHPPIIIPNIGKENLETVRQTITALEKLNQQLKESKPDTLIIISPHAPLFADAFCLNLCQHYQGNFQQFGDLITHLELSGNIALASKIKAELEYNFPLAVISQPELDHGTLVPLYYLTKGLPNLSIISFSSSLLNLNEHFNFGYKLKDEIINTEQRVAFIASGDLSHRLTPDAPANYSPQGRVFDQTLIKLLKDKDSKKILNLDEDLINQAGECGLRPITILLGLISKIKYQPEILSYQGPFGVGYLVANFKLE